MTIICVTRIRGLWGVHPRIKDTMAKLNITKVNHCKLIPDNAYYKGMLKVCKDYVMYGELSEKMAKKLLLKRARLPGGKKAEFKDGELDKFLKELSEGKAKLKDLNIKPLLRLSPPKGGYKSTKKSYPVGDLGKRPTMDIIINKMI